MLRVSLVCPSCGAANSETSLEFWFGALAGEVYEVGDSVLFNEDFSFFAQSRGDPNTHSTPAKGCCETCGTEIKALISMREGVITGWCLAA